ncbi:DNA mismatch repair protein MutS [Clostridium tertium]|jgi:MutS domain V|uniref:MutS-related protein n=1 Tax=Clostridium TaxID=1485 RepID=UPI001159A4B9|nr:MULTISPECIES: MutS family DNA mismatch repair protein [Clostridium]MBS5307300.1 DNA mismatch repair protein MutS [Clostridium sp.]MBS5884784.1 DNA mismatch repair protein MutS [Clostridium sp.]MDB1921535.1 DNA mismatch repair protein MutS [Clostridium tertium]MDB1924779.1 DNA mismatch repair protein MutS [Clostridium tertium]MDB1928307.1 DNA mismatch repair protein MutS [Clostridium tertium]
MSKALSFYEGEISKYEEKIKNINGVITKISTLRLIIAIMAVLLAYYFYKGESIAYLISSIVISVGIFIVVAYYHNKRIQEKREYEIYININRNGINRIKGTFKEREDKGEEFLSDEHPFASDLDIFGRNSLFQMINSTKTKFGRAKLSQMLNLNAIPSREEILKKQEAINELGKKVEWRQRLEVKSTIKKSGTKDINELLEWANRKSEIKPLFKIVPYLFIAITMISIVLVVLKVLPISYVILVFMINYLVVKILTKDLVQIIKLFDKHKKDIEAYTNLLILIENENFDSVLLKELKNKMNSSGKSCVEEMKALKKLVDWLGDSSSNAYYLLLNVTVLSDTFILRNLEEWRRLNGHKLEAWLNVMGEFEALSSISNLSFDFDEWSYPTISNLDVVEGINIGHPMLGERAVVNSFTLNHDSKVALITGSNMSGKSTFLRTIGLNLLLSYIGAPTCSNGFTCGVFSIYTCMRTKDNLEESISSFYAEILRIKILIEAAKNGEKVFFLLDEIFKGTNSKDRHEGAQVLINQLVNNNAMGLVSTHDLELCDLEKTKKWIKNYNFQEYYEKNNIKFDYKLREGRSKTQNAVHLMKLAGIEFNDN